MLRQAEAFYAEMDRRRTTRHFSSEAVPRRLIELALLTAGLVITAIHRMGLVTLTHTLNPVGYPAPDAKVPDLRRLQPEEFIQWNVQAMGPLM
jgi:hypothetical protein